MTTRLPENLDLIAAAPDGIRTLRGLILELAVRGKLVPQDPDDEPASELLKRIAKGRKWLEAEGTCKKSKPVLPVGEDEQWHEAPENWQWSRLGQLVLKSGAGWSPACERRPRENDGWEVLKVGAVSWGLFDSDQDKAPPSNVQPRAELEVVTKTFSVLAPIRRRWSHEKSWWKTARVVSCSATDCSSRTIEADGRTLHRSGEFLLPGSESLRNRGRSNQCFHEELLA